MKLSSGMGGLCAALFYLWVSCSGFAKAQVIQLQQESKDSFTFSTRQEQVTVQGLEVKNNQLLPWFLSDSVQLVVVNTAPLPTQTAETPYIAWLKVNGFITGYYFQNHVAEIKLKRLADKDFLIENLNGTQTVTASYWIWTSRVWRQAGWFLFGFLVMYGLKWAVTTFLGMRTKIKARTQI